VAWPTSFANITFLIVFEDYVYRVLFCWRGRENAGLGTLYRLGQQTCQDGRIGHANTVNNQV
jgi:hypothetical protein